MQVAPVMCLVGLYHTHKLYLVGFLLLTAFGLNAVSSILADCTIIRGTGCKGDRGFVILILYRLKQAAKYIQNRVN